jgi:hypothetical protein
MQLIATALTRPMDVDPPPDEAIVIDPVPLVIVIPVPAVRVAFVNVLPVVLPISSCPSV